ncbi:trigger factor-like isoform X2 [Anabrus simplex]|uniref:trigger factor-like isoform X1 n=1 Tax=Anabrus simplex TaxID=316456 RepID=UPI0035A2EBB1
MRGLVALCVLLALATAFPAEQQAQVSEEKVVDTPAVNSEDVQEVGKHHPHGHNDHDWDHHNHHNDDWDHHHHHDDHNNDHHHHHDDQNNDNHHNDGDNDNHQPDPSNLCAAARSDMWHLPYPQDVHKFVKCDLNTGKGTIFTCPSDLVFNPAIQVCAHEVAFK